MSGIDKDSTVSSIRISKFGGDSTKWPFFKAQFMALLGNKEVDELLSSSDPVPKDGDVLDATTDALKIKIRKQNRKAFGLLTASIDYATSDGEIVFEDVRAHMDVDKGY